jgi:uncharacterized membrane protein
MKRDDVVSIAAVVVILLALVVAWMTNASGVWGSLLSGAVAAGGSLLLMRAFRKYDDERLVQIRNLSARNVTVFLLLALPLTGAALALQSGASAGVAAIFVLWILSLAVLYFSGFYYYRK